MVELHTILSGMTDLLLGLGHMVLPQAGVGGGMEVVAEVDAMTLLMAVGVFVVSLAGFFGLGLAMAAQKFAVKVDPRIEDVKGVLAGAHCGACGYAGCEQYAEAVVTNPDVPPNLCTPGGARVTEAVARISGKLAVKTDPITSRIMCQGSRDKSVRRFIYQGVKDCRAAVLAGGGDKACVYGCLGYGTCASVCPFDAIHMDEALGLPIVNVGKCTGCRKCEKACPKQVIEVIPTAKAVMVACHSKDKGGDARKLCEVACIACGKCVKVCPFNAAKVENNLSRIDLAKCQVCGLCVPNCPTNAIADMIPVRPKAVITDRCIGCHKCAKICPVNAPSGELKQRHVVNQALCVGCGICTAACPKQAIEGTFNASAVMEAAVARKSAKEDAALAG
jgi:Na+-translocating ferredoxin:NAD+ oxidoreductase RNF subunit RnfB